MVDISAETWNQIVTRISPSSASCKVLEQQHNPEEVRETPKELKLFLCEMRAQNRNRNTENQVIFL